MAPRADKQARGGLFDLAVMVALLYAVYAMTPFGAVTEGAIRWARGEGQRPDLFATFKGRGAAATGVKLGGIQPRRAAMGDDIRREAGAAGVDAEWVAALVEARGQCSDGHCTVDSPPTVASTGELPLAEALAAWGASAEAFDGDEQLGLEALFVGEAPLRQALTKANAHEQGGATSPEIHGAHLPPALARGPFRAALEIIAIYRLRTLTWPTALGFPITSPFGERTHPVTGQTKLHNGVDVGCPTGTPITAAQRGRVSRVGADAYCGTYMKVDYGTGIEATFCHLSKATAKAGQWVSQGEAVALSGATGRITGPHLHYTLRLAGEPVDALAYGWAPKLD